MFPKRMGLEKPWSEVVQHACLRKKDLIGTRKVGRCIGNQYCSYDDCQFKLSAEEKRNTSNFKNVDGHKICFIFENVASRKWCGASKMTEYCRESESFTIYHICVYKHLFKPDKNKYSKQVRDVMLRNSGLVTHGIQQTEVGQAVAAGDIKEA